MVNTCDLRSSSIVEERLSATNDCYESEDDDEDIEEKSVCYSSVEPDLVENGVIQTLPTFGCVKVVESSNVHFGNKTYYQGPVTVLKQTIVSPSEVLVKNTNANVKNGLPVSPTKEVANTSAIAKVRLVVCSGSKTRRLTVLGAGFLAVLLLVIIFTLLGNKIKTRKDDNRVSFTLGDTGDGTTSDVFLNPSDDTADFLEGKALRIRDRQEWLAQPPVARINGLKTPVPAVIISHSATDSCFTTADCILRVRIIQQFHIESKKWSDIGYNFMVGGEGAVYEGRGWDKEGAHTLGWNTQSIGICVIGTFTTIKPTAKQLASTQQLIKRGVALGKIAKDYRLLAHNQTQSTESPGKLMFDEMSKWPHWFNTSMTLN